MRIGKFTIKQKTSGALNINTSLAKGDLGFQTKNRISSRNFALLPTGLFKQSKPNSHSLSLENILTWIGGIPLRGRNRNRVNFPFHQRVFIYFPTHAACELTWQ